VRREKPRLENEGQMMESKGRRAARANAPPAETSSELQNPIEMYPVAAEAPEAAEHIEPSAAAVPESSNALASANGKAPEEVADFSHETLTALAQSQAALAQSQAALARGLEALSAEIAGLALSGIDTAARAVTRMLGIKTLSDAIEVNASLTCSSFDALVSGSARLSELGAKLAAETSQPLFSQLGKAWIKPARRGS
jgi:hypothetical protein